MSTPRKPRDPGAGPDPATLSLSPGRRSGGAAFGNVGSGVASTESRAGADFGRVRSAATSTEAGAAARAYTVRPGDTLSHIAQAHFGRASLWPRIFDANRDQLDDPDLIRPGQVLRIPAADR